MLGRLRMNVPDCILEYQQLGGRIFGHPRRIISMALHLKRNRYSATNFEKVINELIDRRKEGNIARGGFKQDTPFEVERGLCKM